jgi:hypothetical protein
MKYLILTIPSVEYAKAISKFLYALSVPSQDQSTKFYNSWIEHPQLNKVALSFPDDELPINPDADAKLLVDQVRQAITEDEAQAMEDRINEGGLVKPIDFIPASLSTNILTHAEMESAGWFYIEKMP